MTNQEKIKGAIRCPVCKKEKVIAYEGASGKAYRAWKRCIGSRCNSTDKQCWKSYAFPDTKGDDRKSGWWSFPFEFTAIYCLLYVETYSIRK